MLFIRAKKYTLSKSVKLNKKDYVFFFIYAIL